MKKEQAEKAIRHLCHQWAKSLKREELVHPSFSSFKTWMEANGHRSYFDFRSIAGADYDAERWFNSEFKQSWRE